MLVGYSYTNEGIHSAKNGFVKFSTMYSMHYSITLLAVIEVLEIHKRKIIMLISNLA